jgi:hypothetical protein
MEESDLWRSSTEEEKYRCSVTITEAGEELTWLAVQMNELIKRD